MAWNYIGNSKNNKKHKKCVKCGTSWLFGWLDKDGYCKKCQSILKKDTIDNISSLNEKLSQLSNEYNLMKNDRDSLYNSLYEEAKKNALSDIDHIISEKNDELNTIHNFIVEQNEYMSELSDKCEKIEKQISTNSNKLQKVKNHYNSIINGINTYFYSDNPKSQPELIQDIDELLSPTVKLSLHCMDLKELRKQYKQTQDTIKSVLDKYQDRYTTKANVAIYQLMVIALQAELQNILYNVKYGKHENLISDLKQVTQKYMLIASEGNQSIAPTIKKFIAEIEGLFIHCIDIEYEYYVQKEKIKEEQRALKEQMKQEAEERRLLEEQEKQISKEESKYKNEISTVKEAILTSTDNEKIKQLQERLDKLQTLLDAVEEKKEEIYKLQNGKAGYVYIISNLGSFGDNVFKIGMTRRLDPQDRVNELSNASVPFPFDVHSFIFSEDAVNLENNMHKKLFDNRLNKINNRKEFFKVSIDELEDMVFDLEPTAEFTKTLLAEQYHQSLEI